MLLAMITCENGKNLLEWNSGMVRGVAVESNTADMFILHTVSRLMRCTNQKGMLLLLSKGIYITSTAA